MKVLGHRVLIRPDEQPEADGLILLPQDREFVATSGTVAQVGAGSALTYYARQRAIQQCVEAFGPEHSTMTVGTVDSDVNVMHAHRSVSAARNRVRKLLGTADPEPELRIGDRVAFDADSGLRITVGGDQILILNHDDVVLIVSEAEEAA